MKYSEFLKHLKSDEDSNIYLIYGSEKYLVDSGIERLKEKYIDEMYKSFNYASFDNINENIGKIENACETIPFMAEKKVVEISGKEFLGSKSQISKDTEERLDAYFKVVPESTIVLISGAEKVDKRKKIFKTIKKHGIIIDFGRLDARELSKWIEKQFKSAKKTVSPKVINSIAYSLGYLDRDSTKTLYDVKNEIDKLCNNPSDVITEDLVESMLTTNKDLNVFSLVEAVGEKDAGKAIKIFTDMLSEGDNEMKILYMITRQYKILTKVKSLVNQGYSPMNIAPKIGLPQYIAKKHVSQASMYKKSELINIMNLLVELEGNIKSGKIESRLGVEIFISSLGIKK